MTRAVVRLRAWAALLLGAGLAACGLQPPATTHDAADQASIAQAQQALDRMGGLKADFTQIGPGANDVANGVAWFEPGHLRLDYAPPLHRVVVATHGRLTLHDEPSGATTRIALASNPLGLLLAGPVHLSGDIDVTDIQRGADTLQLSLDRASNPAQGLLTLLFVRQRDGALLLSSLEAVDAEHHRTRFDLSDQQTGQHFDPSLFTPPG
ncbi:outer membrane lipoprotein carrier protein LolA [Acetobacteraceae bacterium KSS8]|uniref:Outer membrane lipoprotein carrier protein LolA n=1 Tax=Endosaccharibacter trunci TaxID=2812733 RepID=A0ABT1W4P0_9PROT|nr:outer membrane lipoprotein carrier protein LolA [Acetobacteraceae bacterium KSS8]